MYNVMAVQVPEPFKYMSHEPGSMLLLQPFFSIKNRLQFTTCSSTSEQIQHLVKKRVTAQYWYPALHTVRQKHQTVFEVWKPAYPLRGASIITVIMYSDVWSCWSAVQCKTAVRKWNCLPRQSQQHCVVSDSSFKDMTLLTAILCCCGYRKSIKRDQWRAVNKDIHVRPVHLTRWSE